MSAPEAFRAAILAALPDADPPQMIEPGKLHRFSSSGRRADTAGWCKLFPDQAAGVFGCFRAGISETWTAAARFALTLAQRAALARQVMQATAERERAQRQQWAENAERIRRMWAGCVPLQPGDPVTLHLKRRGFGGVWPLPVALRYHPRLPFWRDREAIGMFPAMVAPLVLPDRRTVALHRTYLTRDGRKADVPEVRKVTGAAGPLAGACIPLHKPAEGRCGIAEGIETALGAWLVSGVPTVAAFSAGNMAAWQWPAGLQRLVIFADHDKAGREAADALLLRAVRAGLRAEVLAPTEPGADWCNVWAQHASQAGATA